MALLQYYIRPFGRIGKIMQTVFDLESEILKEHSKVQTVRIARWVGNDKTRFSRLMHLFLSGEPVVVQRSSWIVSHCIERYPSLAVPWIKQLIAKAEEKNVHNAATRNVVRSLQFVEIPKKFRGRVVNFCFKILPEVHSPVAAKAFAMTVLANIARFEPDLKHEIVLVLGELMANTTSAGIRARAKIVLKELSIR